MLRVLFLAIAAVLIVSVGYILLPGGGSRPGSHLEAAASTAADPTTFVVHQAQPVVPVPASASAASPAAPPADSAAAGAAPSDLDAVMQRLRAGQRQDGASNSSTPAEAAPAPASPLATATPDIITPTPSPKPPDQAAQAAPAAPPVLTPPPQPAASRWTNVTSQGARWRMTPGRNGYTVQIDLTGGRVADVHVAPAFANLDPSAMNQRVDYLKSTILQNFPPETASYTFARDGSVSLDR